MGDQIASECCHTSHWTDPAIQRLKTAIIWWCIWFVCVWLSYGYPASGPSSYHQVIPTPPPDRPECDANETSISGLTRRQIARPGKRRRRSTSGGGGTGGGGGRQPAERPGGQVAGPPAGRAGWRAPGRPGRLTGGRTGWRAPRREGGWTPLEETGAETRKPDAAAWHSSHTPAIIIPYLFVSIIIARLYFSSISSSSSSSSSSSFIFFPFESSWLW